MPIPQAIMGAITAVQSAHRIGKRAKAALAGDTPVGQTPATVSTMSATATGIASSVATAATTTAATAAAMTRKAQREGRATADLGTNPLSGRWPWWARATIWLMVILYPFWTLAQAVPSMKIFPGQWLSPTYGQVFGFGDVPGYMGLQDMWDRIKPAGTQMPPGWQPTDAEMRAVFATYDWSNTCTQAATTITTAGIVTPVADDTNRSWLTQTFGALGTALREEMLDPTNLREYGQWFWDGAKAVTGVTVNAFLQHTDSQAQTAAYSTALASFETETRSRCACPTVAGPSTAPAPAGGLTTGAAAWGGYTNGQIPLPALMPLRTAPGQVLRADAAAAFDAMSRAYAAQMGSPIAVTDSYRTYAQQVATKAAKGHLAATPGTSNHGWAMAVDLGGGINTFGSTQRAWMVANAATYGWVSPSWARQGDSKPEAWHWEYVGGTAPAVTTVVDVATNLALPTTMSCTSIPAAPGAVLAPLTPIGA